jgi:AbrB family looped-hinge helix DNA binding protein
MHATIYGRGQMVIPAQARKEAGIAQGDIVAVKAEGDGRIVLVRLERPKQATPIKARITYRKGTHAVGSTGRPITSAQVLNLLSEL